MGVAVSARQGNVEFGDMYRKVNLNEGLGGGPEGEADVVREEEAGFGGFAGVGDGHEDDCACKGALIR